MRTSNTFDYTPIGKALGLYGEFADGENRLMARYVKPGDHVIDVGANLGTTVLPLAKAVGPQGQVIAFEPQPLMAQCLQTTLTLNECFNVRLLLALRLLLSCRQFPQQSRKRLRRHR